MLFGLSHLKKAAAESNVTDVRVIISIGAQGEASKVLNANEAKVPEKPESFVIARSGNTVAIAGSDEVGTMYGCFELAERLSMDGRRALDIRMPIVQSPFVEFRAMNPFLSLPYGDENDWWFLSDDFWTGYLDMLARARINWIDLHGMYGIESTGFPNLYPYFIKSDKFPEVGVEPHIADRNLQMLNKVIGMAKDRGIKFAIMSYSASWNGPGLRKSPYEENEENLAEYTREVVANMIRQCPDLAMIGFRVGESGRSDDFFLKSYVPAIKESRSNINLYTRSWFASKGKIVELGRIFPGRLFVEIKYNGEHYGPPHLIAGGRMSAWHDYSYRSYLNYPRPYKVIWQVRQSGTQRVFPWGNSEFVARTSQNSHMGGAIGFSTEPLNCYSPAYDYLHRDDASCKWYRWMYQRDWYFYETWGRMSYNPDVPERVWLRKFKDRYGAKAGEGLYRAFKAASQIIPYAKTFYSHGPDHRNHAPELETSGSVATWANIGPFDEQNVQFPREYAERLINGTTFAAMNPMQAADLLAGLGVETMRYLNLAKKHENSTQEFACLTKDLEILACLGSYYATRLRAATTYSVYRLTGYPEFADATRSHVGEARIHWDRLATIGEEHYKPFVDTLRMKTERFTWRMQEAKLAEALAPLESVTPSEEKPLFGLEILEPRGDGKGPTVKADEEVTPAVDGIKTLKIRARVDDPAGLRSVLLKFKTYPSESRWQTKPMTPEDGLWTATVQVRPLGLLWCIEALDKDGNGTMWPHFLHDVPYRVVEPWEDPAMLVGSMAEVLEKLANGGPEQDKYSAMFVGTASVIFRDASPEVKANALKAVEQGMSLILDCQDLARFDLTWLPGNLTWTRSNANKATLDTSHPILKGLPEQVEGSRIAHHTFESDDEGWTFIADPKAIAIRTHGKGRIILVQLRMMQKRELTPLIFLDNLINFACGDKRNKPLLVLDEGGMQISQINPTIDALAWLNVTHVLCDL